MAGVNWPRSYKVWFKVKGEEGWFANSVAFSEAAEAKLYGESRLDSWHITAYQVRDSEEEPNHSFVDGQLQDLQRE